MSSVKQLEPVSPNGSYASEPARPEPQKDGGLIVVRCIVTGVSPLLCNAMTEDQLLSLWDKSGKGAKTKERPKPREWADARIYRLADGRPCIPARNLYSSLINAGKFVRLDGKRQISTSDATVLPGMLTLSSVELPLLIPGTKDPAAWEVDIQQGRNPNGGEAVCIIRPRFDSWEIAFEIEVDRSVMPLAMARDLIDLAGRRCGLGDFRPQKKGTFGRFAITEWKHG